MCSRLVAVVRSRATVHHAIINCGSQANHYHPLAELCRHVDPRGARSMKTSHATVTVTVDADHRATIQLPSDIEPGVHRLTITIDEIPTPWGGFPSLDIPWTVPEGYTFRREDEYGEDGR